MRKLSVSLVVLLFASCGQKAQQADCEPENDVVQVQQEVVDSVKVDSVKVAPEVGSEGWADTVNVSCQ